MCVCVCVTFGRKKTRVVSWSGVRNAVACVWEGIVSDVNVMLGKKKTGVI